MNGPVWADSRFYFKEINYIAKRDDLQVNKIRVDDKTFGEPVVFVNENGEWQYWGYLDQTFYLEMEGVEID